MSAEGDRTQRVRVLVAREPAATGDGPGQVGSLQRLCRVAARELAVTGVGVSVVSAAGVQVRAAASDDTSELIEELQFTLGEGPCVESYRSGRAVLTSDLTATGMRTWPGYGPAAHAHGVRAVFAFPMQVGTVQLGVMDVYRDQVGGLSTEAMGGAVTFAELAAETLIQPLVDGADGAEPADGSGFETADGLVAELGDAAERRFEVYQAQGMLMMQLDVSLAEALVRLRAHAFAHDRRLAEVAHDVVERRLKIERDD